MTTLLAGSLLAPGAARAQKAEHVAKVEAALPQTCSVKPQKPRRLLVFNRCRAFVHGAIPLGAKTFELMGKKTGAFEAVLSDDPAMFEPASLKQFDAVCMNNTTGPVFTPADLDKLSAADKQTALKRDAALKKSLLEFVRSGKGLVGVHAATDCLYEWAEYGEMIGGYFDGHPWGAGDTVGVKLDDPGHPLCAAFNGSGFSIKDEIYQFRATPYSREKLRVLLSIDPAKSDMTKKSLKRADGDYAIAWVQSYGKGRVFYCSLGHNESVFWDAGVLQHYLDGIQFALGDLPADTTPSAKLTAADVGASRQKGDEQFLDAMLPRVAKFDYGGDAEALHAVAAFVNESHASSERRHEIAARMAALLETDATMAAKQFVCKQLWRISGAETVPTLARLLRSEETADMARYALERMPDAAAGKALRDTLTRATGKVKAGIISSLGQRRDAEAASALVQSVRDADAAIAQVAIVALGKIGGSQATVALTKAKGEVGPSLTSAVDDALLLCASRLFTDGDREKAAIVYETLHGEGNLPQTRAAALKGLVAVSKDAALPLVLAALEGADATMRGAAGDALREMEGSDATRAIAAATPRMKPQAQVMAIYALADRGDRQALSAVTDVARSDNAEVRTAALVALATLGDASSVPLLARLATAGKGGETEVARDSLRRLRGADIDAAIVSVLKGADAKVRVALIRDLVARRAHGSVPALLATAADDDKSVRVESFKALAALAGEKSLPKLLELLVDQADDASGDDAEDAVVAVANRVSDPAKRTAAALAVFPSTADNIPARCALVRVLGKLGDDSTLEPLRADLKSPNAKVREAAIRTLANWQTPAPLEDLFGVAEGGPSETLRLVALRACFRLLTQPTDRPATETVKLYERGLGLAQGAKEKRLAFKGLAEVPARSAVDLIKRYESDEALKADVTSALKKLKSRARQVSASHNSGAAKLAIDGDIKTRWATNTSQKEGQWFVLDMAWEREVRRVILDATPSGGDYPRGYAVYVSNSADNWGEPVATGEAMGAVLEVSI